MRGWRWFIITAGTLALIHAAGTGSVTYGLLLADVCAIFWAMQVHVILEPKMRVTDADLWDWLDG